MISTLRDAEFQIEALKRQQNELIKELRSLNLSNKPKSNGTQVKAHSEVDNILTADQNTVVHKLYHIFDRIKTRVLEITDLIVTNLTATNATITNITATNLDVDDIDTKSVDIKGPTPAQFHISDLLTKQGCYVQNIGNDTFFSHGVYFNGSIWEAVNTDSVLMHFHSAGVRIYINNGNTIGASVSLISVYHMSNTGVITSLAPIPVSSGGTGATTFTPAVPLIGNGTGVIAQPVSIFTGTIYVSASSGAPATTPKTFINGICTS